MVKQLALALFVLSCCKDAPKETNTTVTSPPPQTASAKSSARLAPADVASVPPEVMEKFQKEMRDRNVDLDLYDVHSSKDGDKFVVYTMYKKRAPGQRGSDPAHPDYEVEVDSKDFSVKRVSIAR
jgi:hypothetical protein